MKLKEEYWGRDLVGDLREKQGVEIKMHRIHV